jgi:hypothetical protein
MIKTKGFYQVNIGNDWVDSSNMLLTGFYNTNLSGSMYLSIGSNDNEVAYEDEDKPDLADSNTETGLTGGISFTVDESEIIITQQQDFDFGLGHDFTFYDIGLTDNNSLVSRALMPSPIVVEPTDSILARYIMKYTLPRAPIVSSIKYNGANVAVNIYFVNPNKWSSTKLGQPMVISIAAVGSGWSVNNDASLIGSFVTGSVGVSTATESSNDIKKYAAGFISDLGELTGTFDQIILCNGTAGPANALVLIDLEYPITKTNVDTLSLTLTLTQEP